MAKADSATTTAYYPVMYPFSVNRDKDLRDPQTPSGHFTRLVNFITRGQVIRTRLGITELTHTPDTTTGGTVITNDFSGDANCIAWYRMESYSSNTIVDAINGSNMTGGATSNSAGLSQDLSNTVAPGLTASLSFDNWATNNSAWATCTYANMGVKFPGSVGVDTTFSVTGWMRWTGDDGIYAQGICGIWNAAIDRTFIFYIFSTSDTLRLLVRDTTDANMDISTAFTPVVDTWYHFKFTFSSADNTARLRVCNSAGAVVVSGNATTGNGLRQHNGDFLVGCYNSDSTRCFDGNLQELCIFNDVVSDGEQDSIIAGTYSG
jgi:hypothetical protein